MCAECRAVRAAPHRQDGQVGRTSPKASRAEDVGDGREGGRPGHAGAEPNRAPGSGRTDEGGKLRQSAHEVRGHVSAWLTSRKFCVFHMPYYLSPVPACPVPCPSL